MCINHIPSSALPEWAALANLDNFPATLTQAAQEPTTTTTPAAGRINIPVGCLTCHRVYRYTTLTPLEDAVYEAFDLLLEMGFGIPQAAQVLRLETDLHGYSFEPEFWGWLDGTDWAN